MVSTTITTGKIQVGQQVQPVPRKVQVTNVGRVDRLLSAINGSLFIAYGLSRRSATGILLALLGGGLIYRAVTGRSNLYRMLDISTLNESPRTLASLPGAAGVKISRAVTIERSPEDLYRFWRDLEMAPLYMPNMMSVQVMGPRTSHWTAKTSTGSSLEWDSEITQDITNQHISWRSIGTDKPLTGHTGLVRFELAGDNRGTVVTLEIDFRQFRGPLAITLGKVFGRLPEQQVYETLRNFKELMEAGEIATTRGQPAGERSQVRRAQ